MFFNNSLILDDCGDVLRNFNIIMVDLDLSYFVIFIVIFVMMEVFLYFDFLCSMIICCWFLFVSNDCLILEINLFCF